MSDVRSLLKQARQSRRITHPYAKYTAQGALYCTACTQKLPSESLWETHIASSLHKDKVKDVIRESQRKAKRSIAATEMEGEQQEEEQESRKRVKIQEPQPEPVEETNNVKPQETETGKEGLPEDFFDEGFKPPKAGVDEDEWTKFQADIAQTIRNQEDKDKDEEEEIQRGIVQEFEELNTLEDRVERLKQRRAELHEKMKDITTTVAKKTPDVAEEDGDDIEDEEEWW